MNLILKNIFLIGALCFLSSCAYFFNSKTVDVSINSNPAGADILIEGKNYGKTPLTINLEPKEYVVVLNKEGYGSAQLKLDSWQGRRVFKDVAKCSSPVDVIFFSYLTVYCRDFKEGEYFVNIPYLGSSNGATDFQQRPLQTSRQYQNYYQPYNYNNATPY